MEWYYATDGRQQGPVDDTVFDGLITSGVLGPESVVWRPGMADWVPLAKAAPEKFAAPPPTLSPDSTGLGASPGPGPRVEPGLAVGSENQQDCAECGRLFGEEDLLTLEAQRVCGGCKPLAVAKVREGLRIGHAWFPAMLSKRTGAFMLDGFILYLVASGVQGAISVGFAALGSPLWGAVIGTVVGLCVNAAYFIFFWKKYGASPGKMAVGLKIVGPGGEPLSWKRATYRYLGSVVSSLMMYIGYLMAFLDEDRRALHDRMAQTLVVQRP